MSGRSPDNYISGGIVMDLTEMSQVVTAAVVAIFGAIKATIAVVRFFSRKGGK